MPAATQTRLLASSTLRTIAARRLSEAAAVAVALLGAALLVALASYHAQDPSFDTATTQPVTNLAGPLGAAAADLLLQGFGLAGALPGLALLAWAWRIASRRPLQVGVRAASLLGALPAVAAMLAAIPRTAAWPTPAGPGGAVGATLGQGVAAAARGVLGPIGAAVAAALGLALALGLVLLAFGLSLGEWRVAAVRTAGAARFSLRQGRRAVGLFGWIASGVARARRRCAG